MNTQASKVELPAKATAISRVLTGITTSGTPHLGNYVGSIRPSVLASQNQHVQSFYFLADYHALIKIGDPERVQRSTLEIAASWLAAGVDPERVTFYRQSDIPEITELTWLLTCVAGKGMLNRAHAYKASVDKNNAAGNDADADVTAGLFMYPVLMAADILMFNAHKVPVGRDQIQHIEMARDIAQSFNYRYKKDSPSSNNKSDDVYFTLPEAQIDEAVATLPGLDGRKMSKSYDNTIPLFASKAELKKLIAGIVTDSKLPGEAKDTEGSALFQIYQAFATDVETQAMRQAFKEGISWGDAKLKLLERIDQEIAPMRETYASLISNPDKVETILLAGADKARKIATPFMQSLREAVGLRRLHAVQSIKTDKKAKQASFAFKQYRESDGKFYFKLVDASNSVVLQSQGFDTPKEAGQTIAWLKENGLNSLPANVHFVNEIPQSELGELNLQLKNS
ncbi:MAG TPA: tryptophan--tRNA ligase [Burkholderiaceae bacterium]|nr:tryptophan--tRNA ligase [Burkholderiaceae bacterium]